MGKDTKSDSGLPPAFDDGRTYLVKGSTLNMLSTAIRRNKPVSGKGTQVRQTDDGWAIDAKAQTIEETHPWKLLPIDGTTLEIVPATFGAVMPEIGEIRLDDESPPVLTREDTTTLVVYYCAEFSLTKEDADTYVVTATISQGDVTVGCAASLPADSPGTGIFYRQIGTWYASSAVNVLNQSVDWEICDSGDGSGEAQLTTRST